MNDDAYCVFILIACMLSLVMPSTGQVIVAMFASVLAVAARLAPTADDHHQYHLRHGVAGR